MGAFSKVPLAALAGLLISPASGFQAEFINQQDNCFLQHLPNDIVAEKLYFENNKGQGLLCSDLSGKCLHGACCYFENCPEYDVEERRVVEENVDGKVEKEPIFAAKFWIDSAAIEEEEAQAMQGTQDT